MHMHVLLSVCFFLLDVFIGVIFDLLISARVQREEVIPNEPISWYHRYK